MKRWLPIVGLVALVVYIVCVTTVFKDSFPRQWLWVGYLICFALIASGPRTTSASTGAPLLRRPFRYMTAFIALISGLGAVGVTYIHLRGQDGNLTPAILFMVLMTILTGWLTLTGGRKI